MSNLVKEGSVVTIHYTCTLEDGTVASDSKVTNDPLEFSVGSKEVLSGIDESVLGMAVGEEKSFTLTPEKGYGEYFDERVSEMPKENIPAHFLNQLGPGSIIPLMSKDGSSRIVATIVEIKDESILVDMNHPLAGKVLNFDVEVVNITADAATTESTETLDAEATMDASDE
jgi:FKBP-type peptidyl-prolyl cis-trans isomerase 2